MNKKFGILALGLATSSALLFATPFNAAFAATNMSIEPHGISFISIDVTSNNKKEWTTVEEKQLLLPVTVGMSRTDEKVTGFRVRQGHLPQSTLGGWLYNRNFDTSGGRRDRYDGNLNISGSTVHFSPVDRTKIIKGCNAALGNGGSINKTHSFFYSVPLQLFALFTSDIGPKTDVGGFEGAYRNGSATIRVDCKGVVGSAGDLVTEAPDFKLKDLDLFLTTYTGNETQPDQFHQCKRARILIRAKTSTAGPVRLRLWTKLGSDLMKSELVEASSSFDGNTGYKAEVEKWITVEKTTHLMAKVEDLSGEVFGQSKGVTIQCETIGSGDNFATVPTDADEPPVQAAKVTGVIALNPKTETSNGMHFGKVAIRLESNKSGNTNYKLTCADGREWSGSLPTQKANSGKYVASKIHGFRFNKTTDMGCALRSTTMNSDPVIAIATHTYEVQTANRNTTNVGKVVPTVRPSPKKPNKVAKKPVKKEPAKAAKQAVKLLNKFIGNQKAKNKNQRQTTNKKKIKIFALPGAKKR